jgi:hypothetical protein
MNYLKGYLQLVYGLQEGPHIGLPRQLPKNYLKRHLKAYLGYELIKDYWRSYVKHLKKNLEAYLG